MCPIAFWRNFQRIFRKGFKGSAKQIPKLIAAKKIQRRHRGFFQRNGRRNTLIKLAKKNEKKKRENSRSNFWRNNLRKVMSKNVVDFFRNSFKIFNQCIRIMKCCVPHDSTLPWINDKRLEETPNDLCFISSCTRKSAYADFAIIDVSSNVWCKIYWNIPKNNTLLCRTSKP